MSAAAKHTPLAALSVALVAALSIAGAAQEPGATGNSIDAQQPPGHGDNPSAVSLAWDRSTDNVGVAGYGVYVNGVRCR